MTNLLEGGVVVGGARKRAATVVTGLSVLATVAVGYGILSLHAVDHAERKEIACLALNIYHEARGETEAGKIAVGHVVMNRVSDPRFPKAVCDVVAQGGEKRDGCQFSWWCDGRSDRAMDGRSWERSLVLAKQIYRGLSVDPTRGALWYHTVDVRPRWRRDYAPGPKIGHHVFYTPRGGRRGRTPRFGWSVEAELIDYLAVDRGRRATEIGWVMPVRIESPSATERDGVAVRAAVHRMAQNGPAFELAPLPGRKRPAVHGGKAKKSAPRPGRKRPSRRRAA